MKKTISRLILIIVVFSFLINFAQTKMEKINIINGKIELNSPIELTAMSAKMWALKYQNRPKPILTLSDEDAEVNLIGNFTNQPAAESQIAAFKDFQLNQLKKTRPDLEVLEDGVKVVNGKKVGFIKFKTQAIDQKVFNYYFFTVVDGKILLFNFNCIESLQNKWEKTADAIVSSLKVN